MAYSYCSYNNQYSNLLSSFLIIDSKSSIATARIRTLYRVISKLNKLIEINERAIHEPQEYIDIIDCIQKKEIDFSELPKLINMGKKISLTYPYRKKVLTKLNRLSKQINIINEIDLKQYKEVAATVITERRIVSTPVPMIITITIYIILAAALIALMADEVIPIVSGVIGFIPLISFFLTALHDLNEWRKKYC